MKKNTKKQTVFPPIPYVELDSEINLSNFELNGIIVNYNPDEFSVIFGEPKILKRHGYFENVTTQPNYELKLKYYSNIWVSIKWYETIKTIISEYNIPISPDTLSVLILLIFNEFKMYEKYKEISKNEPTAEKEKTLVKGDFISLLKTLSKEDAEKSTITIKVEGKQSQSFDGNLIFSEINTWFQNYYNLDRFGDYMVMNFEYRQALKSRHPSRQMYISAGAQFKYDTYQRLNNWLLRYFDEEKIRIEIIHKLLAPKNIFNLNKNTKKGYDSIFNDLRRKSTFKFK